MRGLLPRDVDATSLGRAVVAAAHGDAVVSGNLLAQLGASGDGGPRLTEREQEVLELLNRGWPDKRIASQLGISVKTVEKHVGAVLRKLDVRSRTELLAERV